MMIARDLARALDPALIGADVGLTLDPWQAKLLRDQPQRTMLLCSRQSGKTTVSALMALQRALMLAGALIIVVSPSQRQSAEMLRTIKNYHSRLDGVPGLNSESVLKAELANGSRIMALPGTEHTIRGYAGVDLAVIDEAARCEDELIAAVRPMLATSNGKLIALTTPAGKRGWFFEAWTGGSDDWHRIKVTAADCPRISKEFLDEELRELGAMRFSEEYGLEFLEPDEAVFPTTIVDNAFTPEVEPLWA